MLTNCLVPKYVTDIKVTIEAGDRRYVTAVVKFETAAISIIFSSDFPEKAALALERGIAEKLGSKQWCDIQIQRLAKIENKQQHNGNNQFGLMHHRPQAEDDGDKNTSAAATTNLPQ